MAQIQIFPLSFESSEPILCPMSSPIPATKLSVALQLACFIAISLPVRAEAEESPIVVHDMTDLRRLDLSVDPQRLTLWDTCHLVAALQGLANRER